MVPNTSELLPDPEMPVNTVSRRFGSSTLTSLRLFTRAPCTRIRSWLSATCSAGDCVSVLVAMLIVSPSVRRDRLRGLRRRRLLELTSFEQYLWSPIVRAVAVTVPVYLIGGVGRGGATPVRLTALIGPEAAPGRCHR